MNNEKKAPVRQIKFRGLRIDGKGWVYGDLLQNYIHHKSGATIQQGGCIVYEVIPETVGQFTGILDKNGKEIYEGDMVLASMKYKGVTLMPFRAYIFYNDSVGSWQIKYETTTNNFSTDFIYSYEIEIVGHIHEEIDINSIEGKETNS